MNITEEELTKRKNFSRSLTGREVKFCLDPDQSLEKVSGKIIKSTFSGPDPETGIPFYTLTIQGRSGKQVTINSVKHLVRW